MKAASVSEIKSALKNLGSSELTDLCLRLARAKKETKELLTYLLFESGDEQHYIREITAETAAAFEAMNTSNLYLVKKSLRKILRTLNKYIKYSSKKETEAELLLFFCREMKSSGIPFHRSGTLIKLYDNVYKKATTAVESLHDDLQYDYLRKLDGLAHPVPPGGRAQLE